mgnify:CR=1 FL=1
MAAAAKDGKDGPGRGASSASGWGSRVKLDVQKAILGLACHVVDAQLMVLTADGQLRGYAIAGGGGDVMTPLWAVQVQDAADKVVPPLGILTCVPHPAVAGGALILQVRLCTDIRLCTGLWVYGRVCVSVSECV